MYHGSFFYRKNVQNLSILKIFLTVFSTYFHAENTVRNSTKLDQIEKFRSSKKDAVAFDIKFLLNWKKLPQ